MAIKQSFLEGKWYYRLAKVFFIIIPILIIAALAIFSIQYKYWPDVSGIIIVVAGIAVYFLVIKGIWRAFLYIFFGGLENDAKQVRRVHTEGSFESSQPPSGSSGALSKKDKNDIIGWILTLIILGAIYYAYFILKPSGPSTTGGGGSSRQTCVPTGCGSNWYCSGTYYDNGVQKRINGCLSQKAEGVYPSWSGSCRKCP